MSTPSHLELGASGETIAKNYLVSKGYAILASNWRYKKWEIDLIATHRNELIFVEVKTRTGNYFGEPELSVNKNKQRFLGQAASEYMHQGKLSGEARFDIISVTIKPTGNEIHHVEDAFFPRE